MTLLTDPGQLARMLSKWGAVLEDGYTYVRTAGHGSALSWEVGERVRRAIDRENSNAYEWGPNEIVGRALDAMPAVSFIDYIEGGA